MGDVVCGLPVTLPSLLREYGPDVPPILPSPSVASGRHLTVPHRPFRRQVLVNTASSGVANVWAMAVAFVSLPLLLRGLGQEVFGTWVLLSTFSATNGWFSLGDLGVVLATTRDVAARSAVEDHDGLRRAITASLQLCTGLGLIGGLALASIGPFVLPLLFRTPDDLVGPLRTAIIIFAVQIVFDLIINSLEGSLEGLNRVDLSRWVDMFRRTAVISATTIAALATGDIVVVAVVSAASTAVAAVLTFAVLWHHVPHFLVRSPRQHHLGLLRYGRSIAMLRPLGVLQRTMDRVIVGAVLGPAAVTYVEIATQLQAGADGILGATSYAVVPASSWLDAREHRTGIAELAERGTRYSMLATVPLVITVALLSPAIVQVWVGPKYADAAGLASIAVIAVALAAPLAVGSQMLVGMGHASTILRAAAVAIVANLGLSILLVNVVGVVGVFQATIVGALLLLPLLGRPFLRTSGLTAREFGRRSVLPVALPAAAQIVTILGVIALSLGPWSTLILGASLGLAAFGTAAVTLSIGPTEFADIRRALRRGQSPPLD